MNLESFYRGKTVLVTGATGFLGKNLIIQLLEMGTEIYVLARDCAKLPKGLNCIQADLSTVDISKIFDHFNKLDVVFHLAAAGVKGQDDNTIFDVNTTKSLQLLTKASECGVKTFIAAGTYFEFGDQQSPITESAVIRPKSVYAASKAAFSLLATEVTKNLQLSSIILRIFQMYGPHEDHQRLIPTIIQKLLCNENVPLTAGDQLRDFVYVDDVVDAFLIAGVHKMAPGTSLKLNIGSGTSLSVRQVAQHIHRLIDGKGKLLFGAIRQRENAIHCAIADSTQAKSILGWTSQHSIEEGLKKTIEWMKYE
jgi:UDP-glucose 4-epimerase